MAGKFFSIGYEGASVEDFLTTLNLADIELVADIRELPISRKRGFAKTALSNNLNVHGIAYEHLKGLGDPKEGREAAKSGRINDFLDIFHAHMQTEVAKADLEKLVCLTEAHRICLLCYERDFQLCHRNIVAKKVTEITGLKVQHLGVRKGVAREFASEKDRLVAYA